MREFMKVLKLIEVQHLETVSTSKQKEVKKHGKILFTKRNKKIKL